MGVITLIRVIIARVLTFSLRESLTPLMYVEMVIPLRTLVVITITLVRYIRVLIRVFQLPNY